MGKEIKNKIGGTSKIYYVWTAMRQRCSNPKCQNYHNYGGRGIKVCDRWSVFNNFYDDMYPTYKEGLQLDRTNNDGDYEPSNCVWSNKKEQAMNRRNIRNASSIKYTPYHGKYQVTVSKNFYIGRYDTPEEAQQAYLDAVRKIDNVKL